MIMVLPTMYRATQNPDTPNLPFAQSRSGSLKYRPPTPPITPPTPTGNNTEIWTHINKLYAIHGEQEGRITAGYEHRKSIEGKVEKNIGSFPEIHTKLSNLGTTVSDVSYNLGVHKAEFDIHKVHDIIPTIPNPFGDILPYVLIGGVALLAMSGRKSRNR